MFFKLAGWHLQIEILHSACSYIDKNQLEMVTASFSTEAEKKSRVLRNQSKIQLQTCRGKMLILMRQIRNICTHNHQHKDTHTHTHSNHVRIGKHH